MIRPLMQQRHSNGIAWLSACGRFRFTRRNGDWAISTRGLYGGALMPWLTINGLRDLTFPRLRDAADALDAHLTVDPPSLTTPPSVRWRRESADRWVSPNGTWEIVRDVDGISGVRGFRPVCCAADRRYLIHSTLRSAKARTEYLIDRHGPAA